jgi:hypothetical protein
MKKQCSQEHLTPPKEGVREPKPLKKVPPESEERNWVDCAKVSLVPMHIVDINRGANAVQR